MCEKNECLLTVKYRNGEIYMQTFQTLHGAKDFANRIAREDFQNACHAAGDDGDQDEFANIIGIEYEIPATGEKSAVLEFDQYWGTLLWE